MVEDIAGGYFSSFVGLTCEAVVETVAEYENYNLRYICS